MEKVGYLYEHRVKELQRTDLYDIWPDKNCWICNGTGIAGRRVVHPKKNGGDDGARVIALCGCLDKEVKKLRGRLKNEKEKINIISTGGSGEDRERLSGRE